MGNQGRVRALPDRPKKKRRPTPLQALQRERFKLVQEWLRPVKKLLRIGFRQEDSPRSGHNAAMSYNINNAVVEGNGKFAVDPAAFKFSQGPLPSPGNPTAEQDGDTLRFTWERPGNPASLGRARTILLAHNPEGNSCYYQLYGAYAYAAADTLELRFFGYSDGSRCHAYIAFIDEDTGRVSDSAYAGTVVMKK